MIHQFDVLKRKVQDSGDATGTDLGSDGVWTGAEDKNRPKRLS